jgi:APA family basic amino acid/polyamine antiporter
MSVLRVKPLDQILSDAEGSGDHSLKRVLGAGDLIMLAIGAVIGAGGAGR